MKQVAIESLPEKFQTFTARAVEFCDTLGPESALLIVGSHAAGFADAWSDVDFYVVGHRANLTDEQRRTYDAEGQLFVDRGDYEAHYSFFDADDLRDKVEQSINATMWILSTARLVHGSIEWFAPILDRARRHPWTVAEEQLKRELSRYMAGRGSRLAMGLRCGDAAPAFAAAGEVIDAVCKICCLAEQKPYPYAKWRVHVARETTLGNLVFPAIDRAVENLEELRICPSDRGFREWTPIAEFRSLQKILIEQLKAMGWQGNWLDDPLRYVTFSD